MLGSNNPAYGKIQNDEKKEIKNEGRVLKDCYKICTKCGNFTNYSDIHKYCHICGTMFLEECPKCKEPIIYPNSKFCPMCGIDFI